MTNFVEEKKRSVLPIYAAGVIWLLGGILLPLYRLWALVLTAAVSAAAYAVAARLCPLRIVRREVPWSTGDAAADEIIRRIGEDLDRLHAVNERIAETELSTQMDRMEKAGRSIQEEVAHRPEKAREVRRFAAYYLPDAVKILDTYARMTEGNVKGENAASVQAEVYRNAAIIATAFENQLDALYSADALDISTDLEVLRGLLQGQGLSEE